LQSAEVLQNGAAVASVPYTVVASVPYTVVASAPYSIIFASCSKKSYDVTEA